MRATRPPSLEPRSSAPQRWRVAAAASLGALVAGGLACGSGGLDQVDVGPDCAPGDLSCEVGGIDAPIAMGAVLPLDLDLDLLGTAGIETELWAADPSVLKVSGTELTGLAPGMSALIIATTGGQVLDFTHVYVAEPTRVALHLIDDSGDRGELAGPIQLLVGDEIELAVVPYADGVRLSGRVDGEWEVSGEAVTGLASGVIGHRRLVARAVGSAEVSVVAGEQEIVTTLEVLP